MRQFIALALAIVGMSTALAQYNVGTSTTSTNAWGQQVTTHKDSYGRTTGTSTTGTNAWGQQQTQQNATNSNTSIWTW